MVILMQAATMAQKHNQLVSTNQTVLAQEIEITKLTSQAMW